MPHKSRSTPSKPGRQRPELPLLHLHRAKDATSAPRRSAPGIRLLFDASSDCRLWSPPSRTAFPKTKLPPTIVGAPSFRVRCERGGILTLSKPLPLPEQALRLRHWRPMFLAPPPRAFGGYPPLKLRSPWHCP